MQTATRILVPLPSRLSVQSLSMQFKREIAALLTELRDNSIKEIDDREHHLKDFGLIWTD